MTLSLLAQEHIAAPIVGRFAPSPSGRMHLGNLLAALLAWLDVRSLAGEMLFRLEDLDPDRSYADCAQWLADDLTWLDLDWDRGWPGQAEYAQSCRTPRYEQAFCQLQEADLLYPCYCSRAERLAASAPHLGEDLPQRCACRSFQAKQRAEKEASGRSPAWKILVPDQTIVVQDAHYGCYRENLARESGDFILRRADGVFAYQLAVSVDDAEMGVTHVVRGRDLLPSAARQQWLIHTLGGTAPTYCHTPLLLAKDKHRLSKREGDLNMETLRQRFTPAGLTGLLAYLAGLQPTPDSISARELLSTFSWTQVRREDVILDEVLLCSK